MAKDNKKLVQAITSQEENFAQWYTDICVNAGSLQNGICVARYLA